MKPPEKSQVVALLSVEQFALRTGKPSRSVYDMVADGRVVSIKVGEHRYGIPETEVDRIRRSPPATGKGWRRRRSASVANEVPASR